MNAAIGIEQLKKLPHFIIERRKNGTLFQNKMATHPDLMIQEEIGNSSWFGFSLIIKPESKINRRILIEELTGLGFETRPIVTGNFSKNDVMRFLDYKIPFKLQNAEYIDHNGLFVGNQHFPINEAIEEISNLNI